jgi:hypothetical protein
LSNIEKKKCSKCEKKRCSGKYNILWKLESGNHM